MSILDVNKIHTKTRASGVKGFVLIRLYPGSPEGIQRQERGSIKIFDFQIPNIFTIYLL